MKPAAPLLLIDVDGVISLFGFDQTEPPEGRLTCRRRPAALDLRRRRGPPGAPARHFRVRLVHGLGGPRRRAPPAPARPAPRLGAPDLPATSPEPAAHWKLAAIEAYAGPERAVAWIDDDHDDTCHDWAAEPPRADAADRHRPRGRDHRRARRRRCSAGRAQRQADHLGRAQEAARAGRSCRRPRRRRGGGRPRRRGRARSARRSGRARTAAAAAGSPTWPPCVWPGERQRDPLGDVRERVGVVGEQQHRRVLGHRHQRAVHARAADPVVAHARDPQAVAGRAPPSPRARSIADVRERVGDPAARPRTSRGCRARRTTPRGAAASGASRADERLGVDRPREHRPAVDEVAQQADEVGPLGRQRLRRALDGVEPGVRHAGVEVREHPDAQPVERRRPARERQLLAPHDQPARLDPGRPDAEGGRCRGRPRDPALYFFACRRRSRPADVAEVAEVVEAAPGRPEAGPDLLELGRVERRAEALQALAVVEARARRRGRRPRAGRRRRSRGGAARPARSRSCGSA